MSFRFRSLFVLLLGSAVSVQALDVRSRDPYYGAVAIDAATGNILMEDHASAQAYPASMVKLVNLFVVFDDLKAGKLKLDEPVTVTAEVSQIGGRQVWLKEGEVFSLEELIYAMMVHSANDAAAALAIRASGSREMHAARMTAKAQELGLRNTVFNSVHGLPPSTGQQPDVTSALDMARLAKALLEQYPETLKYTSISSRDFRAEPKMTLASSNTLLGKVAGCDGLKTGYFFSGGFSITATVSRNDRRVIVVVIGCKDKAVRDRTATEWIEQAFIKLPPLPPPPPPVAVEPPAPGPEEVPPAEKNHSTALIVLSAVIVVLGVALLRKRQGK